MRITAAILLVFTQCIAWSKLGQAFPTQDAESPGTQALHFSRNPALWGRLDFGGVDGTVKTSPPDSVKYDRKIEALAEIGAEVILTPNTSLRSNLKVNWLLHKEEERDFPKSPIERSYSSFVPSADFTYINPKGLEMFGGTALYAQTAYAETQRSDTTSSNTQFGSVALFVPRFGIIRRSQGWSGGLYYVFGREGARSYAKSASDESRSDGEISVYIPSVLGAVGQLAVVGADLELDFAQVQASGGGEKSDRGVTTRDDYLHLGLSAYVDLGGYGWKAKFYHNTLSYSNNAFMNIETLPVSSLQLLFLQGTKEMNVYYGVIYGYGEDGQSIPEFNADYKFHAVSLTTGLLLPM